MAWHVQHADSASVYSNSPHLELLAVPVTWANNWHRATFMLPYLTAPTALLLSSTAGTLVQLN